MVDSSRKYKNVPAHFFSQFLLFLRIGDQTRASASCTFMLSTSSPFLSRVRVDAKTKKYERLAHPLPFAKLVKTLNLLLDTANVDITPEGLHILTLDRM